MADFGTAQGYKTTDNMASYLGDTTLAYVGIAVERVTIHTPDLDDVFLAVTDSQVATGVAVDQQGTGSMPEGAWVR